MVKEKKKDQRQIKVYETQYRSIKTEQYKD